MRLEWPRIPPNSPPPAPGHSSEPSSSAPARNVSHPDAQATPSYTYPSPASQSAPFQFVSAPIPAPAPTHHRSNNHAPHPLPQSHYIVPSQTLASSSTAPLVKSRTARFVTPLTTTRPPPGMRISVNSLLLSDRDDDDDMDMDEDRNDELEPSST